MISNEKLKEVVDLFVDGKTSVSLWEHDLENQETASKAHYEKWLKDRGTNNFISSEKKLLGLAERCSDIKELFHRMNKLDEEVYNVPENSRGIPWLLASEILCLRKPKIYSMYRGKQTISLVRFLFSDITTKAKSIADGEFPDPPHYHEAAVPYYERTLRFLVEAGIKDADYRLVDLFFKWFQENKKKKIVKDILN